VAVVLEVVMVGVAVLAVIVPLFQVNPQVAARLLKATLQLPPELPIRLLSALAALGGQMRQMVAPVLTLYLAALLQPVVVTAVEG
jgi:hypothetical protein